MVQLSAVINELVEEGGVDRVVLGSIISEGLLAAYEKNFQIYHFALGMKKK